MRDREALGDFIGPGAASDLVEELEDAKRTRRRLYRYRSFSDIGRYRARSPWALLGHAKSFQSRSVSPSYSTPRYIGNCICNICAVFLCQHALWRQGGKYGARSLDRLAGQEEAEMMRVQRKIRSSRTRTAFASASLDLCAARPHHV